MSDYADSIYNCWEGFKGRETCQAGYLWCREESCAMYKQNPVKKNNTLKYAEDTQTTMILEKIGKPAMLEQLAEEAAELAQAALKLARKLRNENPTPVTIDDAVANLLEEVTDVSICLDELKIRPVKDIYEYKRARCLGRLEEKEAHMEYQTDEKRNILDDLDLTTLVKQVTENRVEIDIHAGPEETEIQIRPWKPFEYACPYRSIKSKCDDRRVFVTTSNHMERAC